MSVLISDFSRLVIP